MIEVRRQSGREGAKHCQVEIDGVVIDETALRFTYIQPNHYWISVNNKSVRHKILAHRFSDLIYKFDKIDLFFGSEIFEQDEIKELVWIKVYTSKSEIQKVELSFELFFEFLQWKQPWSIKDYWETFKQTIKQKKSSEIRWKEKSGLIEGVEIYFTVKNWEAVAESEIIEHSKYLREMHELTLASLISELRTESVAVSFDFPDEVRIPCEQYLVYFVQFLQDLGIEATSELKHETQHILFTVTPKDSSEALDKIRAALEVYLRLPSSPIKDSDSSDIAIQRCMSQIYRLKSDLALAQAVMEAKNATIQAQRFAIDQQQRVLSGEIIIDSLKDVTPKPADKDKENLFGGTVAITKLKLKGVELNLPEIFRLLKQLFNKKR